MKPGPGESGSTYQKALSGVLGAAELFKMCVYLQFMCVPLLSTWQHLTEARRGNRSSKCPPTCADCKAKASHGGSNGFTWPFLGMAQNWGTLKTGVRSVRAKVCLNTGPRNRGFPALAFEPTMAALKQTARPFQPARPNLPPASKHISAWRALVGLGSKNGMNVSLR